MMIIVVFVLSHFLFAFLEISTIISVETRSIFYALSVISSIATSRHMMRFVALIVFIEDTRSTLFSYK